MVKKVLKHVFIVLISILLVLSAVTLCVQLIYYREKENISVQTLDFIDKNDPVYLTSHRGVTAVAPENTLPGYIKAVEDGYYSAECDIRLTKDNVWVLSHDDTTFLHFWGIKNISQIEYEKLSKKTYKNGVNFYKYENLRIPTLDEYLDTFIGSTTRPQIEIKSECTEYLNEVLLALRERGLDKSAIIISFNYELLDEIRKSDKDIELWYLSEVIDDNVISDYKLLGENSKLAVKLSEISDDDISSAVKSGVNLAAWTVNKVEDLERAYTLGIRYITTDVFCN